MSDEILMKMQRIIASDHCTADQMCGDCPCKESANRIFSEIMLPEVSKLKARIRLFKNTRNEKVFGMLVDSYEENTKLRELIGRLANTIEFLNSTHNAGEGEDIVAEARKAQKKSVE